MTKNGKFTQYASDKKKFDTLDEAITFFEKSFLT